jgi:septum formation inhibitor-activating ATPase MinD
MFAQEILIQTVKPEETHDVLRKRRAQEYQFIFCAVPRGVESDRRSAVSENA